MILKTDSFRKGDQLVKFVPGSGWVECGTVLVIDGGLVGVDARVVPGVVMTSASQLVADGVLAKEKDRDLHSNL